jgi:hypothetical protein
VSGPDRFARAIAAAALAFVGLWMPVIGLIASSSEDAEGRKYLGFLEGDWFLFFGLVGAGTCLWAAARLARAALAGRTP